MLSPSPSNYLPHPRAHSDLHTVSKARCARAECSEPALKLSKYCSDRCGILVAASKLEGESLMKEQNFNSTSLNLLWDAVASVKKLETVIRTVEDDLVTSNANSTGGGLELDDTSVEAAANGNTGGSASANGLPPPFSLQARVNEEQQRLEKLQANLADYVARREALENSLALANARLTYFNYAKGKWRLSWVDRASQQQALKPSAASGNKKASAKAKAAAAKSGGGEEGDKMLAAPADAPCGFDVRLVWDDRDWQEWLESEEGVKIMQIAEDYLNAGPNADPAEYIKVDEAQQGEEAAAGGEEGEEEGLVCTLSKKKCDRHAAWQRLRQADFDVEKNSLERQLGLLTDSERRVRRRVEDIQDFLRRANGKLSAMSSNAATPLPNGNDTPQAEEEGGGDGQDAVLDV
ncbi:hypothetical protein P389DRAFT_177201 [Cystobasidium minutum MCA 4210]|uniref:uncharacterized protein n=1 Tax=Cystobasidium minutum MCA 4210 TaxID=1397322 RepID=UPI0034CFA6E0|eukprot:jgi/Rhomi1/177201/fgenesh1_pg.1_\